MKKIDFIRFANAAFIVPLLLLSIAPVFLVRGTAKAGQLTARSIQMSDSAVSGGTITSGIGSGTNVAYKLSFTPTSTVQTIGGIVVDFCSNSALVGDSCTAPTSFNVNRATTAVSQSGCGGAANSFTTYTSDATNNRIIITRGTAAALTSACVVDFGVSGTNGFTNPSGTPGTFYARVYTYATQAAAQAHNSGTPTGYYDSGAMAISTANVINITARVQEILTFCTSLAAPTGSCGGTTTPTIQLGHGSTTKVLDGSAVDANYVYSQISTNAGSGATVRMRNSNNCGGLSTDGGTTCGIPAAGSGAGTAAALAAGTSAFGLSVLPGAAIAGGSGTTTPDSNYYSATHVTYAASNPDLYFGMDTTTATNNTILAYGDPIFICSAPVSSVNNQLVFAATASNTVAAGLYSANVSLIATGQF